MYAYHGQTKYKRENLQNAESLDEYIQNGHGENPGNFRKWVLPRL